MGMEGLRALGDLLISHRRFPLFIRALMVELYAAGKTEKERMKSHWSRITTSLKVKNRCLRMECPVMVQLINKLDTVRREQCAMRGNRDEVTQRKRLRAIESFLNDHQDTCVRCRQIHPDGGIRFGENIDRRKF